MNEFSINGESLTSGIVAQIAENQNIKVGLSKESKIAVQKSRAYVEKLLKEGAVVYGLTTGFGKFQDKTISPENVKELQVNLIRSHSVGTGEPFPENIVRAAMLIRANTLAKGYSGIRLETVEKILEILNKGVYPYVPEKGSVGASGDLAPLSHLALVLMGEGEVFHKGKRVNTADVFSKMDIKPIPLEAKEGLALNNGTSFMAAIGCLCLNDAQNLIAHADIAAALTLESLKANDSPFIPLVHQVRQHRGQIETAENILKMIKGSKLINSLPKKIQDSYSLRCIPQVHGAVRDTIGHFKKVVEIEINSATDNPLIFADEQKVISAGNFHGAPMAAILDFLAISLTDLSSISERRIAKLVDPANNEGLPAFLVRPERAGLDSGFMILQYTAAALVAESKILAHPASVDSIPTSANQEDHVSMGMNSANKLRRVIQNTKTVLGIELLTSAQAIDLRGPENLAHNTAPIHKAIRKTIAHVDKDRIFYKDMELANKIIESKALL